MSELAIFGGQPAVSTSWPTWPLAGKRERELLDEVLSSDMWGGTGLGPKITALNDQFARYCDVSYGAAVANGTVSMELCLHAWGIGPGDEVVVPAYTFIATAVAVHHVGATPVYADIDPKTLNLDPASFEAAISGKTKAVIPVHIAGHPCDMDPIMDIAEKRGIKVLEDAAQAHGAIYKGRKTGSLGHVASFSFQQSKNMQSGEGGILVSNDRDLIDLVHYSIGKFGRGVREKYAGHIHYRFGFNACYTELQAALALAQLERLEEQTQKRAEKAKILYSLLINVEGIEPLVWQPYCTRHGHHLFLMRFRSEAFEGVRLAQFLAALNKEGVPSSSLYPMPLYEQPLYREASPLPMRAVSCPVTEEICTEMAFIEQNLLLADTGPVERIAGAIRKLREKADELRDIKVSDTAFMGSATLKKAQETAGGEN